MSLTKLIDDLTDNSERLRSAMMGADVDLIEEAVDAFCATLDAVRSADPAAATGPDLREKLGALGIELQQSRALACLLSDMTGQMHDLVVKRAMDVRQPLYGRSGERYA
jgi:hypothetical protein